GRRPVGARRSPGPLAFTPATHYRPAMRIGCALDLSKPLPAVVEQAQRIAEGGFATAVSSQIFGPDTLTMLAVVGAHVPDIGLATSVVPTWPRHPVMLAAQALTVQAVTGGRLTLGIGLSHQIVV